MPSTSSKEGSSVPRRFLLILPLLCAAAALAFFLIPGTSSAADPTLTADVGAGDSFSISLKDASGNNVSRLEPGTYTIVVHDRSTLHNFHLSGPGNVDQKTSVELVENKTWSVTLVDGTYTFKCDAHPIQMKGTFTVGPPPPPPPPPPKARTLKAVVGPGFTISVKNKAGKRVKKVKAGKYKIKVRDRASIHNFHLIGKGVNKKTGVPFVGRKTWKVRFKKGKTYRYRCDPHRKIMKGKFKAV
jgi:plastocyanin